MSPTPKACPSCGKTTIKVHRHDITPFTGADHPADPIAWQCVYCGMVFDREPVTGRCVPGRVERVVLAPGELETLATCQTRRNRAKGGDGGRP